MYIFNPKNQQPSDRRAAIVFFFGGGWQSGSPTQFQNQCRRLAERGMVALAADYRVQSRHGANVVDCVADAKSAIRWVRSNAERLGVDPGRIAAGGGSAGGHLAACTALVPGFDDKGSATSSVPNALVLFNPALALARMGDDEPFEPRQAESIRKRIGGDPEAVSPFHHIRSKAPPTIIFHGKDDSVVPYRTIERFAEVMAKAGNRCELVSYDGQSHGFFNYRRGDNAYYQKTLAATEQFLEQLGFLVK
jgi:acetyl esterase/lipase